MGFKKGDFPNAESYYESAISIPLFHVMTFEQQDQVIVALEKVLK
jgi:dTDP-4-amino-4,6-dideoxygalactose transaminase